MTNRNLATWGVDPESGKLSSNYDSSNAAKYRTLRNDNFSSGIDPVFYTNDRGSTTISHNTDVVGGNSGGKVKLDFWGNVDDTYDALAQLAFTLPAIQKELIIEYDLYIPSNYSHVKPSDNLHNNKFIRLWQTTYTTLNSGNKIGASMFADTVTIGDSQIKTECQWGGTGSSVGAYIVDANSADHMYPDFIRNVDRGAWMHIKVHAKAPTLGSGYWHDNGNENDDYRGDGFIRIYKNDTLIVANNELAPIGAGAQGWRYGYILGAANSGFRSDTFLYLDNLVIRGIAE